ncbi:hypothetical protein [Merismopedia glauca]|uniref:Uncharacterized protein n=1 Tax=Merismopedia glauca CCAP 1448/3 TaxID=1296344 RepID=A0A2T1C6H6_9CYAN|nr:hypothetical protein [Merismopedia glauca]PSB03861.1 hypothetical protein C7B64_06510 [Merismopedia glauca CCAP 1448/3]
MKSLNLSQIVSGTLLLTGLGIVSLGTPSMANMEGMNDYQIGRHAPLATSTTSWDERTKSISDYGMGGGMNNPEMKKTEGMSDYQIGRH